MWFLIVTLFPNVGPGGVLMGHAAAIFLYTILFLKYEVSFPAYLKYLMLGTVFFSITIFLSLIANYNQTGANLGQIRYVLVPVYWIFGLLAGVIDAKIFAGKKREYFYYLAAIFIIAQLPFIVAQVLGIDTVIWTAEKARDWSGLVRVVGTVQNPNTLGVLTVICTIIFANNLKHKPVWSKVLIAICLLIILATGSRTSLVLVLILPILFISKEQLFSKKVMYVLLSAVGVSFIVYFLLLQLRDVLPYMTQILNLVEGRSVHTLDTRLDHWANVHEIYYSSSLTNILFGFGPGQFPILDNSFFYILFNYGIPSILMFGLVGFLLIRISNQTKNNVALRCLLALLISGLVADFMLSFLFMTIIYYFIGLQSNLMKDV